MAHESGIARASGAGPLLQMSHAENFFEKPCRLEDQTDILCNRSTGTYLFPFRTPPTCPESGFFKISCDNYYRCAMVNQNPPCLWEFIPHKIA